MTSENRSKLRTAFITGANGYIGNAVARAFVRAGWITYGLVRSETGAHGLASEEILPVIGAIDDVNSHDRTSAQLPPTLDAIVSTTEDHSDYVRHYNNIVSLLRAVSSVSSSNGLKPLVIFTSGCKDYGLGPHFANDPNLAPHTEESPLNPPAFAKLRAEYSQKILENHDAFSPVLVRPTNVHGRSSSFYSIFFQIAQKAADAGKELLLTSQPDSICHCMHVDDCADAYVAIAAHPRRADVEGQVFNISARRYETVDELGKALVAEYKITQGIRYVDAASLAAEENPWTPMIIDFPQWTGSEKLRRVTGWTDYRPLFTEALHVYRLAYEAAKEAGHENVVKVKQLVESLFTTAPAQDLTTQ
ncbi:NAD(P)-binding protein [Cryphonectria parasitica EP155]|uniref:NAD(P)-binding protein n=1 Tax=Cryphonectria parasitica (strain ATCC 38755 / EP155) TaxID=660469 RepID=A0A9P5CQH0_CRYP1|nr:NAD(P)-binding protein [Cryphonectria parasitica EP155]KAF3767223.1 NAD(P)-binding protein [Cryphonectria parasitica EP155]